MKKKTEELLADWLKSCPCPVVARVITDCVDLMGLSISASLYDPRTLVVIPLATLEEFEKYQK
jgi:hypothetical protein